MSAKVPADARHWSAAFGRIWQSDLPLHALESVPAQACSDIEVKLQKGPTPGRHFTRSIHRVQHAPDGSRFESEEFVADTYQSGVIDVWRGPTWSGALPAAFFGTVAASLLTWMGGIAMHASAVAWAGKAILICGPSRAGKSTLSAAMIATGARLISDDLSLLWPQSLNKPVTIFSGRRTMRLFPQMARIFSSLVDCESIRDEEDKVLVAPPRLSASEGIPLACLIVLSDGQYVAEGLHDDLQLRQHLYRPRITREIPGYALRCMQLQAITKRLPVLHFPALPKLSPETFLASGHDALNVVTKRCL
jgi:hypothetical protein